MLKSGDFWRIPQNSIFMNEQEHFYRSVNISDEEQIGLVDRWILACLIKGLQGKSKISKISLDKIVEYCKYTNEDGKDARFGTKTVQASIDRLEAANMIRVIKPNKRGQCTQYEIKNIDSYEKISDEFFKMDLSPSAKGYILCMLQHNLNKDKETHQPNDVKTKTRYNAVELSTKFHTPLKTIYKTEKTLKDLGILNIENDSAQQRDQETGLIIQNREIDLQKVGLDKFVIKAIINHEQRLQNLEQGREQIKEEVKEEVEELMNNFFRELNLKLFTPTAKIIE